MMQYKLYIYILIVLFIYLYMQVLFKHIALYL